MSDYTVPGSVYEMAVKGRQDFRRAFREERGLSADDVRAMLKAASVEAGSIGKWARAHGIKPQQADSCLRAERPPEPKILAALGLERVVKYRIKPA
jgi:hypothetical protein